MMDHTIRVTIPFQAGMSEPQMMLHILRLQTDAAKEKGWRSGGYKPNMTADQIVQDLKRNQRDVVVHLTKTRSGLRARRVRASPSITIADASGAVDLEKAAKKFTPELTGFALAQMSEKLGARKLALDTAIYGTPGLDRSVRLSAIQGGKEDLALSKVVGYEPNRGASIDAMAAGKLKALIQKSMLDLGIDEGDKRTKNAQKQLMRGFRSKFTLLEEDLIESFMYMVHAHHEVREMNLPYIEAMMTGMKGAEFPEALLSMLSPSPDDFFKGTDAMLIIDSKNKPQQTTGRMQGISNQIISLWTSILNVKDRDRPVSVTEKQREVASLLDAFNNDRVKMVQAIERACRRARRRGGDFISAFRAYPLGDNKEAEDAAAELKQMVVDEAADLIDGGDLYNLTTGNADGSYREDVLAELEKNGMANRIGDTEYFIVPMAMPRFPMQPVGWDRRWMVATMRVIDEYWNVIYGTDGLFISDLLYLIASRAYELFNYSMDSEDLLLLTVLLMGDEGAVADDEDEEPEEPPEPAVPAGARFDPAAAGMAEEEAGEEAEEEAEEEAGEEAEEEVIEVEELPDTTEVKPEEEPAEEEADGDDISNIMNTGDDSRRARRGILPRPKNSRRRNQKTLRTVGDLIGISGVVSGQAKEITELERQLQTQKDRYDQQVRLLSTTTALANQRLKTVQQANQSVKKKLLEQRFEARQNAKQIQEMLERTQTENIDLQNAKKDLALDVIERDRKLRKATEEHTAAIADWSEKINKATTDNALAQTQLNTINQQFEKTKQELEEANREIAEKFEEIKAMEKKQAIADSKYLTELGKARSSKASDLEKILQLEKDNEALMRQLQSPSESVSSATELRQLADPVLNRLNESTIRSLVRLSREELNEMAENMGVGNPAGYGSKGAVVEAMLDMRKAAEQDLIESVADGGRRASRKARKTTVAYPDITITRTDGKGKDLGLVTAEVLVGVNIFSDIATAIRDFFGGRSKSGQNKLKTAIALLIAEMKEKAGRMGADSISNFHAEPFMYGSSNSMIGLYGFGVARKTGRKASSAEKDSSGREKTSGPYETQTQARSVARIMSERGKDVYMWYCGRTGGYMVSQIKPTDVESKITTFPASSKPQRKASSKGRSYKGMMISKTKDGWKVDAFDKDFKTLKMARDFISKQVKGAASANSQCPRVIGRVRCRGTVKKGRVHWKCNACHAEFREAK